MFGRYLDDQPSWPRMSILKPLWFWFIRLRKGTDYESNRKAIFNRGMVPNINPNPRGRKGVKRGRKPLLSRLYLKSDFIRLNACSCTTHSRHSRIQ